MTTLTPALLVECTADLCARDPDLARIHARLGTPPLWQREPGFSSLVYIILEQQVSLSSARAAYTRLQQACQSLTPETFLRFDDTELKIIGFSRQKTRYCRELAISILNGTFDLENIAQLNDQDAYKALIQVKGIGAWTANIYLLMALLRPDAWPPGDIALEKAYQKLVGLEKRPDRDQMAQIAMQWSPLRAVAARLLWHYYLSGMPAL